MYGVIIVRYVLTEKRELIDTQIRHLGLYNVKNGAGEYSASTSGGISYSLF